MTKFDELYDKVRLVKESALFECTSDMDEDDIAFVEMCYDIFMEAMSKEEQDAKKEEIRNRESPSHKGMTNGEVKDYEDFCAKAFDKIEATEKMIKVGKIAGAFALVGAAVASLAVFIRKVGNKSLDKRISKLEEKIEKIKKKSENGDISPNEAKSEISAIKAEIKAITAEAKKAEKSVKESADDIKLAIYESCHSGEITEEQRDELLSVLD